MLLGLLALWLGATACGGRTVVTNRSVGDPTAPGDGSESDGPPCGSCPDLSPHCSPSGDCVACLTDDHCEVPRPFCEQDACVECRVGSGCSSPQICNPFAWICVDPCADDTDCRNPTPFCELDTHVCVACLIDGDCKEKEICTAQKTCQRV